MPERADSPAVETMPEVEEAFEEIEVDAPLVGIIMGSKNDKPKMQPAGEALQERGIRYEVRVTERAPRPRRGRASTARTPACAGCKVIIAGAGMSAALPGVAAAHTDLPVIGVPITGKNLGGLDALLSVVRCRPASRSPAWRSTAPRTPGCWPPGSSTLTAAVRIST